MAPEANSRNLSQGEAKRQLGILLSWPFSVIGKEVISWISILGSATVFLFLALCKDLPAEATIQDSSATLLHRSKINDNHYAGERVYRHGSRPAVLPRPG